MALPVPSPQQTEFLNAEIGVIIHLDMQVFEETYNFRDRLGEVPDPAKFNPSLLDTDQWIETAVKAGAKYAVFVAKHCSGFSLWPTKAHDYSVAASPWKNGKGDLVRDFINSCKKFKIKPAIYCSASCNALRKVDNPGLVVGGTPEENLAYFELVKQQLSELWGNYGELFEVWFDGGIIPVSEGGPDLKPLIEKYQKNALILGADKNPEFRNRIRNSGSEDATAILPAWSTVNSRNVSRAGSPDGDEFMPIEADIANRSGLLGAFQGGWFWHRDQEHSVRTPAELLHAYYTSVGRNSNLLLGMCIDNRGLVPEPDRSCFEQFGDFVRRVNALPRDTVSGSGKILELAVTKNERVSEVLLREDFTQGERIRRYHIDARIGGNWKPVFAGEGVGHKRLLEFSPVAADRLRLVIDECVGEPLVTEFSAYFRVALCTAPVIRRSNAGMVLMTAEGDLKIHYTLDGSEPSGNSPVYTGEFPLLRPATVRAIAVPNESDPNFPDLKFNISASIHFGMIDNTWKVIYADSEFDGQNLKSNLLDSDIPHPWISGKQAEYPHDVVIDMMEKRVLNGFHYSIFWNPGAILTYEFYIGDDPEKVETLVSTGSFQDIMNMPTQQTVEFAKPVSGRYVRFRAVKPAVPYSRFAAITRLEFF